MVIFKKKKQEKLKQSKKVVGAYIPCDLAEYLALYGLVFDVSIGSVIEELLTDWNKHQALQKINLITMSAGKIVKIYKTIEPSKKMEFEGALIKELTKKGLHENTIQILINFVKDDGTDKKEIIG
jgi:hypothetical protein